MAGNPNDTLDMSDMPGYTGATDTDDRPPGHFEKRYLERNPGPWHRTTTIQVRRQLQRCFVDITRFLTALYAGEVVLTAYAEYKWIPETKDDAP